MDQDLDQTLTGTTTKTMKTKGNYNFDQELSALIENGQELELGLSDSDTKYNSYYVMQK